MQDPRTESDRLSRRQLLQLSAAATAAAAFPAEGDAAPAPLRGRIRQSVMGWCFKPMSSVELARAGKAMGLVAMEGIPASDYAAVKELGLEISLVSSHGFSKGPYNPANHEFCRKKLIEGIDLAAEVGAPGVITFTGMIEPGIAPEKGAASCVELWKSVIGHAEKKGINLCLEHLNTRDDTHPMKGHPGYFGDDVDYCVELIRKVDSPRMKLLFDIYHVQIMNGDVIRRIRQHAPWIGHVHTAGNPGRCELDENQEIHYPAVLRALLETGYEGYVAQEFIPTWRDPMAALGHAIRLCDV